MTTTRSVKLATVAPPVAAARSSRGLHFVSRLAGKSRSRQQSSYVSLTTSQEETIARGCAEQTPEAQEGFASMARAAMQVVDDRINGGSRRGQRKSLVAKEGRKINTRKSCALILMINMIVVVCAAGGPAQIASAAAGDSEARSGTTKSSYAAEPIHWSFGGWNPLNGRQAKNGTAKIAESMSAGGQAAPTSPMPQAPSAGPALSRPTQRPSIGAPAATGPLGTSNRQQQQSGRNQTVRVPGDAMNESASSAQEKFQYSSMAQGRASPQSASFGQHHLHSLPAYALPLQKPPTQFSAPAPMPIVRDHLLPATNGQNAAHQQRAPMQQPSQYQERPHLAVMSPAPPRQQPPHHPRHDHQQQHLHQHHHHHHQMMHHHNHRQMGPLELRAPMSPVRMQASDAGADQLYQQHRQMQSQMMQQHRQHMIMMQQQQPRPTRPHHQHVHMMMGGPMQPRPPYQQPPMQHQRQADGSSQQRRLPDSMVPATGGYKPQVEDEQQQQEPVMFTSSLPNDRIPMIEVSAQGYRNESLAEQSRPNDEPGATTTAAGQQPQQHSHETMAIEKDSPNYQNAMRQVSNSLAGDQQQRSNNIQDIKQKQQYAEQQQRGGSASGHLNGQQQAASGAQKSSYLTIPVAVETEGDKVLTSDDINEIEKHVINVLPNLKTANKVVKIADARLTLANLKGQHPGLSESTAAAAAAAVAAAALAQPQAVGADGHDLHQIHYDEHRSTMKQLEGDSEKQQDRDSYSQQQQQQQMTTTVSGANAQTQYQPAVTTASMSDAATAAEQQQSSQLPPGEHEYYVAGGPIQEVATIDPDQIADYNLIKHDLLSNIRYEPTRAVSLAPSATQRQRHQPQTASTPPMPMIYTSSQQTRPGRPSVTRYFQQGNTRTVPNSSPSEPQFNPNPRGQSLFGRLNSPRGQYGAAADGAVSTASSPNRPRYSTPPMSSTARTLLGGRKVSEVMRTLIHTTPVPMTTPLHVPSVEPEKVDAIQLIAGQANDKQPIVVEAHQLVHHTPDGGIDYNSGAPTLDRLRSQLQSQMMQPPAQQQQAAMAYQQQQRSQNYQNQSMQQYEQQQSGGEQQQFAPPVAHVAGEPGSEQPGGAIIEYVAITDQALSNALAQHQDQQQQQQPTSGQQGAMYEVSGRPMDGLSIGVESSGSANQGQQQQQQQQQTDSSYPSEGPKGYQLFDYTLSTQHQQPASGAGQTEPPVGIEMIGGMTPPSAYMTSQQQPQQQAPESAPSLAQWSSSIANEHQQQQMELNEHAQPMQQVDMPATAGYNFFSGQSQAAVELPSTSGPQTASQDYPSSSSTGAEQAGGKWRTKAGGSRPNPDAQYDGQLVKGDSGEQSAENSGQQQEQQPIEQQQQDQLNAGNQQQYFSSNYGDQQQQSQGSDEPEARLPANGGSQDSRAQQQQHEQQQQQQSDENGNSGESGDAYRQQQPQQQQAQQMTTAPAGGSSTTGRQQVAEDYQHSTNSYVGGAQFNHQQQQAPSEGAGYSRQQVRAGPDQYGYMKLDHDRQHQHLAQHQAQHQAHLAELMANQHQHQGYQTTTPMSLTTLAAAIEQPEVGQQQRESSGAGNNQQEQSYTVEQVESRPSVQSAPDSMLMQDYPMQGPILDQESLIPDSNQETNGNGGGEYVGSEDDADSGKQRQQQQQPETYRVYSAYYAPKDHKPPPGYVRLSLDEFRELFRDAEIKYVDNKNLNDLSEQQQQAVLQGQTGASQMMANLAQHQQHDGGDYEQKQQALGPQQQQQVDMMKSSASESQAILVDRRSISERRLSNATGLVELGASKEESGSRSSRTKLARAVKKIINIRNSRESAKQQQVAALLQGKAGVAGATTSSKKAAATVVATLAKQRPNGETAATTSATNIAQPSITESSLLKLPISTSNNSKGNQSDSKQQQQQQQKNQAQLLKRKAETPIKKANHHQQQQSKLNKSAAELASSSSSSTAAAMTTTATTSVVQQNDKSNLKMAM